MNPKGVTEYRNKSYHPHIQQYIEKWVLPGPMEGFPNYPTSETWETS
jgi:hypothetical protein